MGTKIEFKNDSAYIEIGNSYISGRYVTSPNGRYFMICGTLYVPSGNDREYALVFTKDEVCYKKLIPNDECGELFFVFDDGQSLVVTDDCTLLRLDATGKQISKCKVPDIDTDAAGIIGTTFYGIGYDDEGNTSLFVYDLESGRAVLRTIPDIEFDDDDKDDLLSSDVEWSIVGDKFVFVYENDVDAVAFDLNGLPVECLGCDIDAVIEKRSMIEKPQQTEQQPIAAAEKQENKDRVPSYIGNNTTIQPQTGRKTEFTKPTAKKKFPTWAIILIIVFLILALIGKFVA